MCVFLVLLVFFLQNGVYEWDLVVFQALIVLDTLVTAFSCYCKAQYKIEPVEVEWVDGSKHRTPELKFRKEIVNSKEANKFIGTRYCEESRFFHY